MKKIQETILKGYEMEPEEGTIVEMAHIVMKNKIMGADLAPFNLTEDEIAALEKFAQMPIMEI